MRIRDALVVIVVLAPSSALAQQELPLLGVVADESIGALIDSATVTLVGEGVGTLTRAGGVFQFTEVAPGRHLIRVQAPGYPAVMEEVDLSAEATLVVQILLPSARAVLEGLGVVVAPTPRATGGSTTAADLLALQIPGIFRSSGDVGTRTNLVLLRGVGSVNLSSEPAVFLDGVQISGSGQVMDRLSLVPATDVRSIQIQRGPAAAFLGGAANGAIYIVTRSGTDDSRRW